MKILFPPAHQRLPQQGSAVIVVLALLAIMLTFVSLNTVAMNNLGRELKLLEKKQVQRLQFAAPNQSNNQSPTPPRHD